MTTKISKKLIYRLLLILVCTVNLVIMFYNIKTYDSNQTLKNKYITEGTKEYNNKIKEDGKKDNNSSYNENKYKDTEYKMFYGEWEVSKIIGEHKTLPVDIEEAKTNIGKRITYQQDKIIYEGQEERKDPLYNYSIIPVKNPIRSYILKMPTLEEIGIKGEYFVFVWIRSPMELKGFLGNEFYIKDDNTLIVSYYDVYYELKRISYIEDHEYGETYF